VNKIKQWVDQFDAKLEALSNKTWMKYFRITTGVLKNLIMIFVLFFVLGVVFVGSIGAGYFASLVKEEPLTSKKEMVSMVHNYEETSKLYFAGNQYLGKMRTDLERTETTLDKVAPTLIDAVIATEDENFYQHNGIVPKAVLRGLAQDISNSDSQTGGSTLTQQLIKNQILTNEVSYERKAKELLLAQRLETFMTKDEILEAYLNVIPYGRNSSGTNIAGVETAAEGIFNVKAKQLNLAQSAYIAGIPQSPYAYTPYTQSGALKDDEQLKIGINRMKTVLYRMRETDKITEKQYRKALKYNIKKDFRAKEPRAAEKYPFVTYEIEDRAKEEMAKIIAKRDGIEASRIDNETRLREKYKILADRELRTKGYKIYSTIDKKMYDGMNNVKNNFSSYGVSKSKQVTDPETGETKTIEAPVQVGAMAIENATGKIKSFVGGRDYNLENTNHATQSERQPGSTIKPLLVYGPAIENGIISAGSALPDVSVTTHGWSASKPLENYGGATPKGIVSARYALKNSLNLPAVRLYGLNFGNEPMKYLDKMGFGHITDTDRSTYSAALGGMQYGSTVEENTNAYATFANNGKFVDAYMISKIVDKDGKVVYKHKSKSKKVFSEETSYIVSDMLRDVLKSGTGKVANGTLKFSADFAAKSGTTQNYNDVWFMGYNKDISLGVWLGYDAPSTLDYGSGYYGKPSERINRLWGQFMNSIYDTNPALATASGKRFQQPYAVAKRLTCSIEGASCSTDLVNTSLTLKKYTPAGILQPFGGNPEALQGAKKKEEKDEADNNGTTTNDSDTSGTSDTSPNTSTNSTTETSPTQTDNGF
jgi:penicillin-binding protein 1B